jgi:tetratricopeptide (TPR) repeat protein
VLSGERPGPGQRHFREGLEAYQRRDLDAVVRHFTLAIESGDLPHPDIFFAFNNRGNAYAARGDYDRALKDYDEALRFNPKFAAAMRNRGTLHARKGDDDSAIRDYRDAARLDLDDPHALIGRAPASSRTRSRISTPLFVSARLVLSELPGERRPAPGRNVDGIAYSPR